MKRFFLGAASAISSLEIIEVSITGKHFLYQNKSENHAVLQAFDIPFFFVVCWETRISVVIIFAWIFTKIVPF